MIGIGISLEMRRGFGGGGVSSPAAFFADFKFVAGSEYNQAGEASFFPLNLPNGTTHIFYAAVGTATEPTIGITGSPTMHAVDVTSLEADASRNNFCQAVVNTLKWSVSGFSPSSPTYAWVTNITGHGSSRNDATTDVGTQFIPSVALTITQLGRWKIDTGGAPDTGSHLLHIRNAANTITYATATVNNSATGSVGLFVYGSVDTPFTVTPGTTYYLISEEVSGGDFFFDNPVTETTTADAAVVAAHYGAQTFKYTVPL